MLTIAGGILLGITLVALVVAAFDALATHHKEQTAFDRVEQEDLRIAKEKQAKAILARDAARIDLETVYITAGATDSQAQYIARSVQEEQLREKYPNSLAKVNEQVRARSDGYAAGILASRGYSR
jgi:hypothetical protein